MTESANTPDSELDLGTGAKPIVCQIEAYDEQYQGWQARGKAIIERYRDVRLGTATAPLNPLIQRKFNILWSNVETLKPTLYARLPKILVEREYKDKDPIARIACEIAERAGNYTIRKEGLDNVLRQCVGDRLLPGRAVARVDYEVEGDHQPVMGPDGPQLDADEQPVMQFVKSSERAVPRYINWEDFGHSPVRTWDEVTYAWYVIYTSKEENEKRWPDVEVPLDRAPEDNKDKTDTIIPQSTIYVVYCKDKKTVDYIHKNLPDPLQSGPAPVDFEGFWPWPRPLFATMTNESLQPVPDFYYYQDQADELDKITNRLARIMDAMKVGGVFDASFAALEKLFHPNGAPDNMLIPVTNWGAFAEKGGMKGAFELSPLEQLAETAVALVSQREQVLNVIYQVTGIADIIRGSSDPNETATAQGIKSQFASLRIKDTQAEVARFARDLAAMIVECIVENFEPETIWQMTLAETFCIDPATGQPSRQMFDAAMQLLRNQKLRDFHIDIETDSTISLDDEAEKLAANEFMTAMATFIEAWGPIVQQSPALLPMVTEMLLFLARRYRAGRSLEVAIEQGMQGLAKEMQAKAANPPPDPETAKAQAQIQIAQQKAAADLQAKQAQSQLDAQLESEKMQRQTTHEAAQAQADMAVQQQKAALDMQIAREKAALDADLARQKAELDGELAVRKARTAKPRKAANAA